ncbi:MAG: sel1 repeat family protein [Gammaproteobacteria bacterium]|nr:sel1 repeat family protein [Gammaproteobacteria bacterium]MCW8986442.1 sel1 repeat family protein [Gammaproteobacteria bacterium]MCW9032432.1 sel1 repeat family protein [Gammaproteobacteria bacterium]
MSLPKPVFKEKAEKISVLYRNYFFMFFILLFFCSLFVFQNAIASSAGFKESITQKVGYAHLQQAANFSQAQAAFENQDYVYSARLLSPLTISGHVQAQYLLATQYDLGLGVKRNENLSFHWYKKAAEAGIGIAQHNLAVAYAQGNGVDADLTKAIAWWERAANAGNTDSQYNLGIIYAAGRDSVKPDMEKALKWWRMAAISGDPAAQFNLGAIYANGIGLSSRTCEASRWWKKSAANGFAQAEMALAVLQTKSDYASCR